VNGTRNRNHAFNKFDLLRFRVNSVAHSAAATTGLLSVPSFSTVNFIKSPAFSSNGGTKDTHPSGGSRRNTSPGSRVIPCESMKSDSSFEDHLAGVSMIASINV